MFPVTPVLGGLFLLALLRLLQRRRTKHDLPLPPGPKPLPLLGNTLQMPTHSPQSTFTEWGKRFGTPADYVNFRSIDDLQQATSSTRQQQERSLLSSIPFKQQ
jgi:hypothetical protein